MINTLRVRAAPRRRHPLLTVGLLTMAILLSACRSKNTAPTGGEILAQYLPTDWSYVTNSSTVEGFQPINIDGDADNEWLLFYHYDSPPGNTNGPIGGIVYDVQQNSDPYNPDVVIPFPYQPMAFFVPYRLLPDWVPGKGQGYLGNTNVAWEAVKVPKTLDQANELLVQGYGANNAVTRVSIFRWGGMTQGFDVTYFQGSYSAAVESGRELGDIVRKVVTLNALNDRSDLCEKTEWTRQGDTASFASSPSAIEFCLGPPAQPTYPEAVVLAYLLTENKPNPPPTLVLPGSVAQVQAVVPVETTRVVTMAYPGAATVKGTGASAVSQMIVETVIVNSQGQSTVKWLLQEQRPTATEKTTRWRILSAEKG